MARRPETFEPSGIIIPGGKRGVKYCATQSCLVVTGNNTAGRSDFAGGSRNYVVYNTDALARASGGNQRSDESRFDYVGRMRIPALRMTPQEISALFVTIEHTPVESLAESPWYIYLGSVARERTDMGLVNSTEDSTRRIAQRPATDMPLYDRVLQGQTRNYFKGKDQGWVDTGRPVYCTSDEIAKFAMGVQKGEIGLDEDTAWVLEAQRQEWGVQIGGAVLLHEGVVPELVAA
jgi:hypothetical protein